MKDDLIITEEFGRLVACLTVKEKEELQQELGRGSAVRPVVVWKRMVLVDQEYYKVLKKYGIPVPVEERDFGSMDEAVKWVCLQQLKREQLTIEMRRYLIGSLSVAEIALERNRSGGSSGNVRVMVREKLAKDYRVSRSTIYNYEKYAESIDFIRKRHRGFVDDLLEGRITMGTEIVGRLKNLPVFQADNMISAARREKTTAVSQTVPWETGAKFQVKNMPAYDPDNEIMSLALTIPTWRSSILRVSQTPVKETTKEGRRKLETALLQLKEAAEQMLTKLQEVEDGRLQ